MVSVINRTNSAHGNLVLAVFTGASKPKVPSDCHCKKKRHMFLVED